MAKQKNVPEDKQGKFGYGSVWTWAAMDADRKLVISYMVGRRDADYVNAFMDVCQIDVFIPNLAAGKPPIILHPEEC